MHSDSVRVAVAQMCSGPDVDINLAQAERLLQDAQREGVQLLVLPENFGVFGRKDLSSLAEQPGTTGTVATFLAENARRYGLWLIAGTVPYAYDRLGRPAPAGRVFPTCGVWSPEGICVVRYDKCHLFDVDVTDGVGRYRESDTFAAGDAPVVVDTAWGRLGLSICYDLRFPEYYRRLADLKALMLAVPSAFTYSTGEAHWDLLLRARAVENQSFVLAANQGGDHGNQRLTWGHSCIVDPWGRILACRAESGPGLAMAQLDLVELRELRRRMPVLEHRRF